MTGIIFLLKKLINFLKQSKDLKVKDNVFNEEINKSTSSSNDDKRMQSIDSTGTYAYGRSKDTV